MNREGKKRELELLHEALLDAFSFNSLKQMMFLKMGLDLEEIAGRGSLRDVVTDLLMVSEREGWTDLLVHSAYEDNPGNPKLQEFVNAFIRYETSTELERIITKSNSFLNINQFRSRLEKLEFQVCQIEIDGDPQGTGFLIGDDLVLTNYHVVESLIDDNARHSHTEVRVRFDYKKTDESTTLNEGVRYELAESDWLVDFSPYSPSEAGRNFDVDPSVDELDFAVLRVAPNEDARGRAVLPGKEKVPGSKQKVRGFVVFPDREASFETNSALFIIQHPARRPLKLAMEFNSIIGVNGNKTRVRHKTNTEPGSSGSPCFDNEWELVALHHAGDPSGGDADEWNQAVPVSTIREYWKRHGKLDEILG